MFKISLSFVTAMAISALANAQLLTEKYTSIARSKMGAVAYQEQHEVSFTGQRVQKAKTVYLDPKGQAIGEMTSDFTKKVTVPEYEYKDMRTNISHGIKLDGDKITLWHKNKDGKIKSLDFSENKFPKETLLVGCQGLHYYLIENLDLIKQKKIIPIVYFMPGKLDYYRFTLKLAQEDEQYLYLKLSIDSVILKLFTSTLNLKYRKTDRRLLEFSGLSNITDDKDQMQNVTIDYKYDSF